MTLWRKLRGLVPSHRSAQERDMQEELESLKAMAGTAGLGNLTLAAENARDVWRWSWIETLWQDIHFSLRTLAHSPGFALTAVLVLSVGIGLNLTFFHLVNIVFLKPLPIRDPETLVLVNVPADRDRMNYAAAELIRSNTGVFSSVLVQNTAYQRRVVVWENNVTDPLPADFVSVNWFEELGVQALRGQLFSSTTGSSGPVAVISQRYWETRLQQNPAVVGATVRLNRQAVRIVGIVPANRGVLGGSQPEIWIPLEYKNYVEAGLPAQSDAELPVRLYGRLRPGLSIARAQAALRPTMVELSNQQPKPFLNRNSVALYRGSNHFRAPGNTGSMWAIIGGAGSFTMLILLITCANLANLVLSRAASRMQELSVRAALGASRARVMRHLISETAILAALASSGALFLAYAGTRIFFFYTQDLPERDLSLDWRTLAAACIATILTTVLIGLLPAWNLGNRDLALAMRDGGQQTSASVSRVRQRQLLLAAQVAGSCLLIVVAGLILRSLQNMLVPPGFDYENVILAEQFNRRADASDSYWANVRQAISEDPNIESIALVNSIPFRASPRIEQLESRPSVRFRRTRVDPDFFRVVRMPFLAGGPFGPRDVADHPVVVSKSLAQQLYGTSSVVGMRLAEIGTIVGVVNDIRLSGPDSADVPQVYAPIQTNDYHVLLLRTRTKADAARIIPALAEKMQDSGGAVPRIHLLETALEGQVRPLQILTALLSSLAGLALTVASMGIFGVVSYSVAVRRKEIGIRLALGARHGSVILLMVESLVWPVSIAIIAGMLGGVIVGRILESNGGAFSPPDATMMLLATLLVLAAVAFACIVPTLRALRSSDSRVLS
jgi:predicted permease